MLGFRGAGSREGSSVVVRGGRRAKLYSSLEER